MFFFMKWLDFEWFSATGVVVYINGTLHSFVEEKKPVVCYVQGRDSGLGKLFMPFVLTQCIKICCDF